MKFAFWKTKTPQVVAPSVPIQTGRAIKSSRVEPGHADILRAVNRRMLRMYEAAISNNLNADFPITISDANAEIFNSIQNTRARARVLERDNPYAWGLLNDFQNNIGGHEPFRLEMKVGRYDASGKFVEEKDTNKLIEDAWKAAGRPENCTVTRTMSRAEMYWQAISGLVRDGGILYRHHDAFKKNKFRYGIEPIEYDRLDHYWQGKNAETGNRIFMSIEVDEFMGPEAYWLYTRHPGALFAMVMQQPQMRERVKAEDMIALFDIRSRAGQLTGMPRFASVIPGLHRIDQFEICHVTAAIWASAKPMFIKKSLPTGMDYVSDETRKAILDSTDPGVDEQGDKVSNIEPGTAEVLEWGQEPVLIDPKFPIETAPEFIKQQLRRTASGSGAAYHMLGNDLEGVNFSSGRLGLESYRDTCKKLQHHIIANLCVPHFKRWLQNAIESGALDLPMTRYEEFCDAAHFHGRRWGYINPLQDAQADILRINAGLDSRDYVIQNSARGGDVERVDAEIAAGKQTDKQHGLNFEAVPTKPGAAEVVEDEADPEKPDAPSKKGGKQTIKSNGSGHHRNGDLLHV